MYRVRISIGVALLATIAGVLAADFFLETAVGTASVLAILIAVALHEFQTLLGVPRRTSLLAAAISILLTGLVLLRHEWLRHEWPRAFAIDPVPAAFAVVAVLVLVPRLLAREPRPFPDSPTPGLPEGALREIAVVSLGLFYVWFLLSYLLEIRLLALPGPEGRSTDGIFFLAFVILAAKGADMGGYLVGKKFGRIRLLPRVSPKKSLEGLAGGIVFSILLSLAAVRFFPPVARLLSPAGAIAFGIVASFCSIAGDLVESSIKRRVGVKDSAAWIPQFGGILDLVDSLMFAAPVGYYFLRFMIASEGG